jgi:CHAT domain-containing protein
VVAVLADPVFEADDPRVRARRKHAAAARRSRALETDGEEAPGPPARLIGSRREADAILAHAPARATLRALDFEASRATATGGRLAGFRVVHFATHGIVDHVHPELSGIVLSLVDAAGKPQDGVLRLHDVYNLRLRADLVVLSACDTALGPNVRGEGLIGLTRGFLYAGARSVLASLWRVDDAATAELMRRFYDGLLGATRLTPAAALRAAQAGMARDPRWSDPFHWAGFVLQGDWR